MAAARARARERDDDTEPKPRSDAYVGMLAISLVAMIVGCVFLYLDWSQYPESKPPKGDTSMPPRVAPQAPPGQK